MIDRGIERGKYDATLPIRERLAAALVFLEGFVGDDAFSTLTTLPPSIVASIITDLQYLSRISIDILTKCQRQTTNVVPPSFHGAELSQLAR